VLPEVSNCESETELHILQVLARQSEPVESGGSRPNRREVARSQKKLEDELILLGEKQAYWLTRWRIELRTQPAAAPNPERGGALKSSNGIKVGAGAEAADDRAHPGLFASSW